eukprot:Hpha_TRINITY_DN20775_c0_g1::TRINITY_DN20775_c0_g1_i1::g.33418::m.33418
MPKSVGGSRAGSTGVRSNPSSPNRGLSPSAQPRGPRSAHGGSNTGSFAGAQPESGAAAAETFPEGFTLGPAFPGGTGEGFPGEGFPEGFAGEGFPGEGFPVEGFAADEGFPSEGYAGGVGGIGEGFAGEGFAGDGYPGEGFPVEGFPAGGGDGFASGFGDAGVGDAWAAPPGDGEEMYTHGHQQPEESEMIPACSGSGSTKESEPAQSPGAARGDNTNSGSQEGPGSTAESSNPIHSLAALCKMSPAGGSIELPPIVASSDPGIGADPVIKRAGAFPSVPVSYTTSAVAPRNVLMSDSRVLVIN